MCSDPSTSGSVPLITSDKPTPRKRTPHLGTMSAQRNASYYNTYVPLRIVHRLAHQEMKAIFCKNIESRTSCSVCARTKRSSRQRSIHARKRGTKRHAPFVKMTISTTTEHNQCTFRSHHTTPHHPRSQIRTLLRCHFSYPLWQNLTKTCS